MGNAAVHALLSHLAVDLQMSPSTQNQALARELRELTVHNGKGGQDRLEVRQLQQKIWRLAGGAC